MEESKKQASAPPGLTSATTDVLPERLEPVGAEVRDRGALEPGPEALDRVELRRVGRKSMGPKLAPLRVEMAGRLSTAMGVESVPEQDDGPPDVPSQMAQKVDHLGRANDVRVQAEVEVGVRPSTSASGSVRQGSNRREPLPGAMAMDQDRRLPARCPGATDGGALGEAALVEEDDRGSATSGVFFSPGQVSRTQRRIAFSLRSRARVVGFCSDQPSFRMSRHTWPAWYETSATRSITAAMRGNVQRSVSYPCARGPWTNACSMARRSLGVRRPGRPAVPGSLNASAPSWSNVFHQTIAV